MVYEKTIGGDDLTFSGELSETARTAFDCLTPADQTELLQYLYPDGDSSKPRKRIVVDGYAYSEEDFLTSHKIGGAEELVLKTLRYPLPVHNWYRKRLFKGVALQVITFRIILSADYNNRLHP
jgi:hypothetical protein